MGSIGAMRQGSRDRYFQDEFQLGGQASGGVREARARGHRGPRAAQGQPRLARPPARRRAARRDGLLRVRDHSRPPARRAAGAHHTGRRAGEPRPRRDDHEGSAELQDGIAGLGARGSGLGLQRHAAHRQLVRRGRWARQPRPEPSCSPTSCSSPRPLRRQAGADAAPPRRHVRRRRAFAGRRPHARRGVRRDEQPVLPRQARLRSRRGRAPRARRRQLRDHPDARAPAAQHHGLGGAARGVRRDRHRRRRHPLSGSAGAGSRRADRGGWPPTPASSCSAASPATSTSTSCRRRSATGCTIRRRSSAAAT